MRKNKINYNHYLCILGVMPRNIAGITIRWLGEMDGSSEEDRGLNTNSVKPLGQNCYHSVKKVFEGSFHTFYYFR